MLDFIKTKKTYIIAIAVLFLVVSLSDATYSLFIKSESTDNFNYKTGLLDLEFIEEEQISLENAFPMNDSEGAKGKPYHLTIKNTGTLPYLFDLKMLQDENSSLDTKYIKVKVNNKLPFNLHSKDNVLDSNILIYPNEEKKYEIYVWLDIDTPNNELGKTFTAKAITSGSGTYKTKDNSGANHPKLNDDMVPVYYDSVNNVWRIADKSNMTDTYNWYNYNDSKWANSVIVKSNDKYIYDLTRKNNLKVENLVVNNGNVVISDNYLDIGLANYQDSAISSIIRTKINELDNEVYFLSNGNMTYYYNSNNKTFIIKNGNNTIVSEPFELVKNTWYLIGYTYDGGEASFYVNGNKLSTSSVNGNIGSSNSFKLGTNNTFEKVSKITIGDILIYNRVLSPQEINNNYKTSMNIIRDGLVTGYSEFTPMTLKEYYINSANGTIVDSGDILSMYVWIPRFKYKLWNVLGEANVDTYNAYTTGIDISFENMDASSGTVFCEAAKCYSDSQMTIPVTTSDNGKYYTHPAFSTTTKELNGLWVSKYEISNSTSSKADNDVLTNNYLSEYYKQIKNISNEKDYHLIKNTEWGAVAYLSHSKYGLCNNGNCTDVVKNTTKKSGSELKDTTTGNIYGVFDMAGSANEYVMANVSNNNTLNLNNSHFNDVPIGTDDYDLYSTDTFILGDATKELSLGNSNWYEEDNILDSNHNWMIRKGIFGYNTIDDVKNDNISTRIVTK